MTAFRHVLPALCACFALPSLSAAAFVGASPAPTCAVRPLASQVQAEEEDDVPSVDDVRDIEVSAPILELLDLAFGAASKFPTVPHQKNRARAQEQVVEACLALDLPRRALAYAERIDNWRRGMGLAGFAEHCAEHGFVAGLQPTLDSALAESEKTEDWRRDRIRARVAATLVRLGRVADAVAVMAGAGAAESGTVEAVRADVAGDDDFDARLSAAVAAASTGVFEHVQNALGACVVLHGRFYADAERRARVEESVQGMWGRLPLDLRIQTVEGLAENALRNADDAHALELVDLAQGLIDEGKWMPDTQVPLAARAAALRYRAGQRDRARQDLGAALALSDASREKITDVFRAAALLPVAEAYADMDDPANARFVYGSALREGLVNPNSRPRANDLVAVCCSMARRGVAPDEQLGAALRAAATGLDDPW